MNELKKYWKEILFLILVVVAYYKIKQAITAAKRKAADKVTKDVILADIENGSTQNFQLLAAQIYEDIWGSIDSNEADIIRILNLVGQTGYPKLAQAYAAETATYWNEWYTARNLMSDLNWCMDSSDWQKVTYSPANIVY